MALPKLNDSYKQNFVNFSENPTAYPFLKGGLNG